MVLAFPTQFTDTQRLLSEIADGKTSALRRLHRQQSARLLGIICRIVKDIEHSEDLLQELFLKIWQTPQHFLDKSNPDAWLGVVARNSAIDLRRQLQRKSTDSYDELLAHSSTANLLVEFTEERLSAQTQLCLKKLKPEQERVILLSALDGYSQHEIATLTKQAIGTVKSWLRRGFLELKTCLNL